MAVVVFDTFTIAQEFEKAGFLKEQIAVLTKAFTMVRSDPELVSKAELQAHKAKLNAKVEKVQATVEKNESKVLQAIADLRKDMDSKMEKLSLQLTVRLGGIMIATLSAFKLLANFFGK